MTSFFSQLYLDLQTRISSQVPAINWIEMDFGQDHSDKWRPNVVFPAVLIDFPSASYSEISGINQIGNITVSLRLLVAPFSQSYEDAPLSVKQNALQFFELEQSLVVAVQGWKPAGNYCQALIRTTSTSNNRNDIGLRIRELQFTTFFKEIFQ